MLSDSDSDSNDVHTFTINDHYAKAFQHKKEREELEKLKEKYGSDYSGSGSDDSEDSEDTEEDSDGEELTPAVDAAILRTLSRIRKQDPAIYEGGRSVFEEEHTRTQDKAPVTKKKTKEKSKPLTIREAALVSALADAGSRSPSPEPRPLTHAEEQHFLRSETLAAFRGAVDSEEGEDDDLLVPRERTRDELEVEEEEYKAFLEREVGVDLRELVTVDTNEVAAGSQGGREAEIAGDGDKEHEGKKKKGKKERVKEKASKEAKVGEEGKKAVKKTDKKFKEAADREFLMNYIFNRGWIDRSSRRVPTYNEIVDSSSKSSKKKSAKRRADSDGGEPSNQKLDGGAEGAHDPTLSDEDSFDDLADAFETSYNFRFEEPNAALIPSFPRNLTSARREPTTRKDARARKTERQETEKKALLEERREEIRQERALVEAAVAEEEPDDNDPAAFAVDDGASDNKKSKKQQKKEELARLKVLKVKELRRKLELVSAEGGLGGVGEDTLAHLDLDADWDPSKHDTQMAVLYGGDDVDGDVQKPTWDDDIDIDDIVPLSEIKSKADLKKQKKKDQKKKRKGDDNQEDVGVDIDVMDADLDTSAGRDDWGDDEGEWKGTEEERKRKVDAYMDEVVSRLGFSGITSHMPTRFHYTMTTSDNYGLTPAEILLAKDAELNSYVGLKKIAPYRVDRAGKKKDWDPMRAQLLKEFRDTLRSRVDRKYEDAWSLGGSMNKTGEARGEKKKRMGKKERARLKTSPDEQGGDGEDGNDAGAEAKVQDKSRKRKQDSDVETPSARPGGGEGDGEEGVTKKKRRRRHKTGGPEAAEAAVS